MLITPRRIEGRCNVRPWTTPLSQKVVYAPPKEDEDGRRVRRSFPIGVRIDMRDGSWWFCSFRGDSWTQHFPRVQKLTPWGKPEFMLGTTVPVYVPERKCSYESLAQVRKEYPQLPELPLVLGLAYDVALEA